MRSGCPTPRTWCGDSFDTLGTGTSRRRQVLHRRLGWQVNDVGPRLPSPQRGKRIIDDFLRPDPRGLFSGNRRSCTRMIAEADYGGDRRGRRLAAERRPLPDRCRSSSCRSPRTPCCLREVHRLRTASRSVAARQGQQRPPAGRSASSASATTGPGGGLAVGAQPGRGCAGTAAAAGCGVPGLVLARG